MEWDGGESQRVKDGVQFAFDVLWLAGIVTVLCLLLSIASWILACCLDDGRFPDDGFLVAADTLRSHDIAGAVKLGAYMLQELVRVQDAVHQDLPVGFRYLRGLYGGIFHP